MSPSFSDCRVSNAMPIAVLPPTDPGRGAAKCVEFCPEEWMDSFGEEFYAHSIQNAVAFGSEAGVWKSQAPGRPVAGSVAVASEERLAEEIRELRVKS